MKFKNFIKPFIASLLLVLLFSSSAFSQYTRYVEPSDIQATADEIEYLFSDIVNVSNTDLVNAMQQMLADYDANTGLLPPDASVLAIQNNSISFDWQDIPGAAQYQIEYLDLEIGQTGNQYYAPGGSPYSIPVANNLHLFAFQSSNSVGGSGIAVAIVEIEIILRTGPCDCGPSGGYLDTEAWVEKTTAPLEVAGSLKHYFATLPDGTSFDLAFGVEVGDGFATDPELIVHGTKEEGIVYLEYNNFICPRPGLTDWGVGRGGLGGDDDDFPGGDLLDEDDYVITAAFEVSLTGDMKMATNECSISRLGRKTNENNTEAIKFSPNPVKTHLNIKLPDGNANSVKEIRIFSISGVQVIHQQLSDFEKSLTIQMQDLQAGIYFVELISQNTIEKRTIIKME